MEHRINISISPRSLRRSATFDRHGRRRDQPLTKARRWLLDLFWELEAGGMSGLPRPIPLLARPPRRPTISGMADPTGIVGIADCSPKVARW